MDGRDVILGHGPRMMATATILHVGDDLCYRIPLIEQIGLLSIRSECTVGALKSVFAAGDTYAGIAFHDEAAARLPAVAETARSLSTAPLILFRNSLADCDERVFDLVVPVQTPPAVWLKSLQETIRQARGLQKASERLRQECADVRAASRRLRRISNQNRKAPIDCDKLWRRKPE